MRLQCKQRHCAAHCKPETKKTGNSLNPCVCLYRSLKLLTDDRSYRLWLKLVVKWFSRIRKRLKMSLTIWLLKVLETDVRFQ